MHKHTEPAITASDMRPAKAPSSTTWAQKLALIGPAFIAGAWQFGPGNLTSAVEAGSAYGYALVWVIAVSTLLMIFFTDMSVRIGIAAPGTMISTIKQVLGKPFGVLAGLSVFFITLCFSVGNAAGSGLALSMLFGGSALFWTAVCTVGVCDSGYEDCDQDATNGCEVPIVNGQTSCVCTPGEVAPCYSGPLGTENVGVCKGGTKTCASSGTSWGSCMGEVLPSPETCVTPDDVPPAPPVVVTLPFWLFQSAALS